MADTLTITPDLTINEVIQLFPATVQVFNAFGLDACCGGDATLAEAAVRDQADLEDLLRALRRAAEAA
ncbi:MAG TPA: DUF542 domain-containing protein [Gemmatimonadaceae bacterium]|nr:DUF542 domain-containing protein [Gemmatimonadaceae bacterium]